MSQRIQISLEAERSVSRSQPSQFTVRVVDDLVGAEVIEQEAAGGQYWLDDYLRFNRMLQLVTKTFQWLALIYQSRDEIPAKIACSANMIVPSHHASIIKEYYLCVLVKEMPNLGVL
jgi:hypothetical protein